MTWVDDVEYTCDNRGNLTHDGVYTYTWNAAGRLVGAQSMTHTLAYTYNGDGVRVAGAADGTETRYVQDVVGLPQVLVETTGGQATLYVYGVMRLAQVQGSDAEWFLGDALGSVRQLVNDDGAVVLARDYDPYGQLLSESGTGSSGYGFTGEQWDVKTGLVFLRARYYAAEEGRFISEDRWPGSAYKPATLHVYLYARNNPVLLADPSGRQPPPPIGGSRELGGRYSAEGTTVWLPTQEWNVSILPYRSTSLQPTHFWSCPRPSAYWLALEYASASQLRAREEWSPVSAGAEVPLPPPLTPANVGWESAVRRVRIYGLGWPLELEEEYWEWVNKPSLGLGIPEVASARGGVELSSMGSAALVFPSVEAGPFSIELQPNQVMLQYAMGWSYGVGIEGDLGGSLYVLAEEQKVIDAGGYKLFGWEYVGQSYQFIRELDRDLVRGWLMAKCKHRGWWPMVEAGPPGE